MLNRGTAKARQARDKIAIKQGGMQMRFWEKVNTFTEKNKKQDMASEQTCYRTAGGETVLIRDGKARGLTKNAAILTGGVIVLSMLLFALGLYLLVDKVDTAAAKANQQVMQEKSEEATDVDLANALRTSAANRVIEDETIPAYSESQIRSLDVSKPSGVTKAELKLITRGNLKGLEGSFIKAEQDYGVNCLFVIAIASLESADGTICFKPNNMFGFGRSGFSSKAECIDVVSRALARNYLSTSGSLYCGKTISAVNKRYAASSTWDDKVAARMTSYYATISKNRSAVLDKLK